MAKRFTDTSKWDKAWFRELPPRMKCAYEFLRDRCDIAGFWEIDLAALEFFVGEKITLEELVKNLKVEPANDNKISVVGFIEFQYGELSEACNAHKGIIRRLQKMKGSGTLQEPFKYPSRRVQDKDKDIGSYFNTTAKEETGTEIKINKLELTEENYKALSHTYDMDFIEASLRAFNVELAGRDPKNTFTQNVEKLPPIVQFNRYLESRAKRLKYKRDQKTKKGIVCS
jgi:hypothetical protein